MKKWLTVFLALCLLAGRVSYAAASPQIIGGSALTPYTFCDPQPYVSKSGKLMFPMVHFEALFQGDVHAAVDPNQIMITKDVLGVQTVIRLTVGSCVMEKDDREIALNNAPVEKDGTIYIPLEAVGSALGYIVRDVGGAEPVQFYQYTSMYVYAWNERINSSVDEVRYTYQIGGDGIIDLTEIKKGATANTDDILNVVSRLPANAKILMTELYSVRGYGVPYTTVMDITNQISAAGYQSSFTDFCTDEIPPIIQEFDDFTNQWYSEELYALYEDAIDSSSKEVYRYSNFPAFQDSQSVRIEIRDDGGADVYYKLGNRVGDTSENEELVITQKGELTVGETQAFLNLLAEMNYWDLPPEIDRLGFDGHEAVVEGVKEGHYYIVSRWVPEEDDPVHAIQAYFLALIERMF